MSTATKEHPIVQVLTTRSGSTYHLRGSEVRRVTATGPDEVFQLISVGERCLRYTDGHTIFITSELVSGI